MDNTEKVENAINQYLETNDASNLDAVKGIVGTEPFGDSELGYCIARGNVADIIARINKITNFSDTEVADQLELDDKVLVDKNSNVEDVVSENKEILSEIAEDATTTKDDNETLFSEEGEIGNQLTDGDTPKEQLELDDKVLIDDNADVDDNEDFVVAEFSDLSFSEGDPEELPTIGTTTLDKVSTLLELAKELDEVAPQEPEVETDDEDIESEEDYKEDDDSENEEDSIDDEYEDEDEDLDSEEFSIKSTFRNNLKRLTSKNFSSIADKLNPGRALRLGAAYVSDKAQFRNLCKQYELDSIERAKIENMLADNFSAVNFDDENLLVKPFEEELKIANAQLEQSDKLKKPYEELRDNTKNHDKLIGGSETAKNEKEKYNEKLKSLVSGEEKEYLADKKKILENTIKDLKGEQSVQSEAPNLAQTLNSSIRRSFRENVKRELHIK